MVVIAGIGYALPGFSGSGPVNEEFLTVRILLACKKTTARCNFNFFNEFLKS